MKMTSLLLTLGMTLVLAASACKNKNEVTSTSTTTSTEEGGTGTKTDQFGGATPADSLFFSLERTVCFGQCKAYRLQIYRSGYAMYDGRAFVEKEGLFHGRVGADTMAILLRHAETLGFFEMEDKYDGPVTDLPSTIIRVVANGKDKKVIGRVGTPASFRSLTTKAEELLLPMPWIAHPPLE